MNSTSRVRWLGLAVAAAATLSLVVGLLVGRTLRAVPQVDDAVDLGFARDMMVHHAQAVEMSAIVHQRTDEPKLSFLAFDVMTTQQGQIGVMTGWLNLWQQNLTSRDAPMAWTGEAHQGSMPGLAARADVAALRVLPLVHMEEQYLRLMIRHHRGALPMASYARDHATSPQVVSLAENMYVGQAGEIELMQDLLAQRALPREPEAQVSAHTAPAGH